MKKFYFAIAGIAVMALALNGCVSISKYTPPKEEEAPVFKMTTKDNQPKVKIEVELLEAPDLSKFSQPRTPDKEITGNRGVFAGGMLVGGSQAKPVEQPKAWWQTIPEEPAEGVIESAQQIIEEKPAVIKYKVKKGQTLQDISKDVYGTTKKWKKIYEANKDKLKSPDKVYAGQVLNIPQEGAVKHLK